MLNLNYRSFSLNLAAIWLFFCFLKQEPDATENRDDKSIQNMLKHQIRHIHGNAVGEEDEWWWRDLTNYAAPPQAVSRRLDRPNTSIGNNWVGSTFQRRSLKLSWLNEEKLIVKNIFGFANRNLISNFFLTIYLLVLAVFPADLGF